ncbi:MAG: thioredoxin domain-containing protein, partial [Myxococcota bacterium]|nr:thioredoxin domain-containing protein [Myxococcota bacterium]
HLGLLDDHTFLLQGLIDLYEATFDPTWLTRALDLADRTIDLFWDEEQGGLYYTGRDAEKLVARTKHPFGGAEPSANGVAALSFLRLESLCGRED